MLKETLNTFTPALEKRFNTQLKKIYIGQSDMKKRRPILNNVNVTENGSVQITNSYVGVQLENTSATPSHLEGYPDMTKIFEVDQSQVDQSVPIYWEDLKLLESHLNTIYKQKVDNVKITITSDSIVIANAKHGPDHVFIKSEITTGLSTNKEHKFNINPRFLHDCLVFFRQVYKKGYHVRIWTYQHNLIKFTYDGMTYVIAPMMRSY